MPSEKKLLWSDAEHLDWWGSHIDELRENGFSVTELRSTDPELIMRFISGTDIFILHCGTQNPLPNLEKLLRNIKNLNPKIKIGLQTNGLQSKVKEMVDVYIHSPIDLEMLLDLLNSVTR